MTTFRPHFFGVVLISVFLPITAFSQTDSSFFPHHIGDMWEYLFVDWAPVEYETLKVNIVFDSTAQNGFSYVKTFNRFISTPPHRWSSSFVYYVVDTLHQVFESYRGWGDTIDTRKVYKLDAGLRELWIVYAPGAGFYIARVGRVYNDTIFGVPATVKRIDYFATDDTSDTTLWLHMHSEKLAEGFGLIWRGGGDLGHFLYLRAARINGVVYDDSTIVSVSDEQSTTLLRDFHLLQNYPNPFNAQTRIKFFLEKAGSVSLLISNALGQEVRQLLAEVSLPRGEHSIDWDGTIEKGLQAASGVYFYQLKVGEKVLTRPMVLLR